MKNTFGQSVCVTLFGESHGEETGAVVDGFCAGLDVDEAYIASRLALRRPSGNISTSRVENDSFRAISGVYNGKTTGAPLCVLIKNSDIKKEDYAETTHIARPGHADYTGYVKYNGYNDPNGGGHFSGRLTAPLVAVGAVALSALKKKGIYVGSRILRCGGICDTDREITAEDILTLESKPFAVLDDARGREMQEKILRAAEQNDSVGGVLQTVVTGLPAGIGEPWFDGAESVLSAALFGIPAVKGVSFGDGFGLAEMCGSEANDAFAVENGKIVTKTNHNGGINGGITNGMPLVVNLAVKPTPSVGKEQQTVDFIKNENTRIAVKGRHDPAVVHRVRAVSDAVTALVVCDLLTRRFGEDFLREK